MRIVLDTSVLVAGLRSESGGSAEVLGLLFRLEVELLMDYKMGLEYREVACRNEHLAAIERTSEQVVSFIEELENLSVPVVVEVQHRPLSQDAKDDMFLDVAINGKADVIVTHNLRHFGVATKFGIEVKSPGIFLADLGRADEKE